MATHAPTTGAPTRAPQTRSVSDRATDAQILLGRIATLAGGIACVPDNLPPMHDEIIRRAWGDVCNFAELIDQVAAEAMTVCELIEIDARHLRREA